MKIARSASTISTRQVFRSITKQYIATSKYPKSKKKHQNIVIDIAKESPNIETP